MSPGEPDEPAEGIIEGIIRSGERSAAPARGPSELLTFLIADIRGYTTFTQQRGDEAAAKLTSKFAVIVRELVAQFDGTVFELRGDEALCVFSSARQSLRVAIALQHRFVEETIADAELPLPVGIGIDAGEAVHSEDGYRGGALNLAARLCARAKGGEVLASAEVTHLARTIAGIRYVVLDTVAVKGLSDPVRPVRVLPESEDPARQMAALLARAPDRSQQAGPPSWIRGPHRRRRRRVLIGAAAAVVVAAGGLVFAAAGGGGTNLRALDENSVGLLDPGNGHLVGQVGIDTGAGAATTGFGSVWTADTNADSVTRIDTSNHRVSHTIDVGVAPSAIAAGLNAVWVTNGGSGTVSRIDPGTNSTQTITVGTAPGGVVVANGSVWVTNTGDGSVSRIDPAQNKVTQTIEVGENPSGIGAGRDIWVANSQSNTLSKIDSRSGTVTQTIHVGNDPRNVVVVGDSVWVTNNLDGTVARIATDGTSVADTVRVGFQPTQIASYQDRLWVATQATNEVAEINPASARLVRTVHVGATPAGLVGASGRLWVTTGINPALHRGGTITIAGRETGPVDPDYLNSAWVGWLLNDVYDGLVGFRHATGAEGTALVPDLASTIPETSNGGRTYSFHLRSGIRWSTGQPLTVLDVQHSLERGVASGFLPMQQEIVGADKCGPTRCHISGIAVDPAASTVTITLVRPDRNFLGGLAAAAVVPASTPFADQGARPVPSTGPYQITRFVPGKLVVLARNTYFREWSAAAQPAGFPDAIEWRIDPSNESKGGVDNVAAGRADWADARVAGPLGALQARFGQQLYMTPTETTHAVVLNTRLAPFNDVRVRRALAFAIDRGSVAGDWFTPAGITCQSLPPDFPGHRPYCPYTLTPTSTGTWRAPDLGTALSLVKASRTQGMSITVLTPAAPAPGIRHVVTALNQLGYHAKLRVFDESKGADYFSYIFDSRNKVQAAFFGWVADNIDPSGFLTPFRCDAFVPASPDKNTNAAEFCDASIDRLMDRAQNASSPATAQDLWAQVDRRIVDAAPWIPLVNPSWVDVVSARVHNYQRSPVLGVFFDEMWVH